MDAEFTVAVHGLVYLWHKGVMTSSEELSENICTNPARVRKVMAKLRRVGLVQSREGKGSGYLTLPQGDKITLREILEALEEQVISPNWHSGNVEKECLIASGMGAVMDDIYGDLDRRCRDRLREISIGDINRTIFGNGRKEGKSHEV